MVFEDSLPIINVQESSSKAPKRFAISVLGCRTNQYEAQAYKDQLEALGYVQAKEGEEADICIVNTCTVTEGADSSSRHAIRALSRQNPNAEIIVTGCLAEREPQKLYQIDGVKKVVSNKDKENLVKDHFPDQEVPEFSITRFEAHTRAFVKVQDGCNSFCSYCVIPYVRGRSRSRTIESVVKEVEALISSGYKEVVITGINVGDFDGADPDGKKRLSHLIREIDALDGLERLRISSIDPDEVDDDLLDAVMNGKKTCHSLHIVLQSGSNTVLKRMNRKYTRQVFLETTRRLKSIDPDFTYTTDIIVGFPGETEQDFLETLEVMEAVQFSKVHMFPYSDRPRTRASMFKDKIPHEIITDRKNRLLRKSEEVAFALRNDFIGREMEILTEHRDEGSQYIFGHTANFLPVFALDPVCQFQSNQLITVRLTENRPDGFYGEIVK